MLNVALVGFGLSGRYLQAPFFHASPHFQLHTIVTQSTDPRTVYPHVHRAAALDEVLSDASIDLVSICTPNATHYEYTKKCLLAGKHVLTEKPFAATAAEAEELFALARQTNKVVYVFQNRRFDSDFTTVQQVIKSGALGDIHTFEAHFNRYKPVLNAKKWKETTGAGSGILYDLGAHIIDQAIALFGTPDGVWGHVATQRPMSLIDDAFDIRLRFQQITVRLTSSLLTRHPGPRYVVHGHKGSFVKYGLDVQEDQLKAGQLPGSENFGVEPVENQGHLHTEWSGVTVNGKVETRAGNWMLLFDNLYDTIVGNSSPQITEREIITQLRIMEQVKFAD